MTNSTTQSGEPEMIFSGKRLQHRMISVFRRVVFSLAVVFLIASGVSADEALPRLFIVNQPADTSAPVFPPDSFVLQVDQKTKPPSPTTPAGDAVVDAPYEVKTLADLKAKADIREQLVDKDGKKLPMATFYATLPKPHYSSTPEEFTHPDGSWIDQRITGPVAPFEFLPTYFQDDSLERFGHTHGFVAESLLSAVHFYATVPVLPYKMTVKPPCQPVLPNYFPPPISLTGKIRYYGGQIRAEPVGVEAAVIAAVFLIFP